MGPTFASFWTQFFPPKPKFTEKDLHDLSGKVYIVTGANSGIGKELSRMLYSKNAKVYVTARSETRAEKAIEHIKTTVPNSKAAAGRFLAAETKLHVLFNNACCMAAETEKIEKTAQGHEIHLGVNCLGAFLLTKLLTPVLVATAADRATLPNTVRVTFMSSFAAEIFAKPNIGIEEDNLDYHVNKPAGYRYAISKASDWAYAVEFSKRHKEEGLIAIPVNPGNVGTSLFRHQTFLYKVLTGFFMYPIVNGAYAELYAGLSPEVTAEDAGRYVIPFGRFGTMRGDLQEATKSQAEGGNGTTKIFWDWSEEQVSMHL